jgi:hypothetical protein
LIGSIRRTKISFWSASISGALYTCRLDLVGFVNGLPLGVIELKNPGVPAPAAFAENLTHCKLQIPALFWFNALLIASIHLASRAEKGSWFPTAPGQNYRERTRS